jgi:hypothetical protein
MEEPPQATGDRPPSTSSLDSPVSVEAAPAKMVGQKPMTEGGLLSLGTQSASPPTTSPSASPPPKGGEKPTPTSLKKGTASFRSMFSFRPAGLEGTASRQERLHKDPKLVFEGIGQLSVQCALGQSKQVKALLNAMVKPDERDIDGDRFPIHWAVARGETKSLLLLLKAGASTDVRDADGRTPAELALACGQTMAYNMIVVDGVAVGDDKSLFDGLQRASLLAANDEPVRAPHAHPAAAAQPLPHSIQTHTDAHASTDRLHSATCRRARASAVL